MAEIILKCGSVALVDDEFAEEVRKHSWCRHSKGYAVMEGKGIWLFRNKKLTLMHQFVWALAGRTVAPGLEMDHVYGDKLDNRLSKLRLVTRSVNMANRPKLSTNTSGYKGVSKNPVRRELAYWAARVKVKGKTVFRKNFPLTDEGKRDAARAVNEAYREHFPECMTPNPEVEGVAS